MQFNVKYTQVYIKTYLITTKEEKNVMFGVAGHWQLVYLFIFPSDFGFSTSFFCVFVCGCDKSKYQLLYFNAH